MKCIIPLGCLLLIFMSCSTQIKKDTLTTKAAYIKEFPTIDGKAKEHLWEQLEWIRLEKVLNEDNSDTTGKYKLGWNEKGIFILMEISHDPFSEQNIDENRSQGKNEVVRIYIDEDNSGGLHHYTHNAFAYTVDLNGNVTDLGNDKKPKLYNDHIIAEHTTDGHITRWEFQVKVFSNDYHDEKPTPPVTLIPNKKIGFALEYTIHDYNLERQDHYASLFAPGEDENQAWINADIFGTLVLEKN